MLQTKTAGLQGRDYEVAAGYKCGEDATPVNPQRLGAGKHCADNDSEAVVWSLLHSTTNTRSPVQCPGGPE